MAKLTAQEQFEKDEILFGKVLIALVTGLSSRTDLVMSKLPDITTKLATNIVVETKKILEQLDPNEE